MEQVVIMGLMVPCNVRVSPFERSIFMRDVSRTISESTRTWYGSRKLNANSYWFMSLRYCFDRFPRIVREPSGRECASKCRVCVPKLDAFLDGRLVTLRERVWW
jgi:hypothetical protein